MTTWTRTVEDSPACSSDLLLLWFGHVTGLSFRDNHVDWTWRATIGRNQGRLCLRQWPTRGLCWKVLEKRTLCSLRWRCFLSELSGRDAWKAEWNPQLFDVVNWQTAGQWQDQLSVEIKVEIEVIKLKEHTSIQDAEMTAFLRRSSKLRYMAKDDCRIQKNTTACSLCWSLLVMYLK